MCDVLYIARVADSLISKCSFHQCDLKECWEKHMDSAIKEYFSFKEVKDYIEKNISLGEKYKKNKEETS